jgi:CyaY protein
MNDEADYFRHAEAAFKRIDAALGDLDVDLVDLERAGDVITLTFAGGKRCVVNTQRPTRQIWVAASSRGWHFRFDGAHWVDEKDAGVELFATLTGIVKDHTKLDVSF